MQEQEAMWQINPKRYFMKCNDKMNEISHSSASEIHLLEMHPSFDILKKSLRTDGEKGMNVPASTEDVFL